jgi:hypothetical protein
LGGRQGLPYDGREAVREAADEAGLSLSEWLDAGALIAIDRGDRQVLAMPWGPTLWWSTADRGDGAVVRARTGGADRADGPRAG